MRALTVLTLVLAAVLCVPACDDDWTVVGEELERTVDELGDALTVLDPCPARPCCDDACLADEVGRLAADVDAWTGELGRDVGRRAAGLEARLADSGRAWARQLDVALAEAARGADELARGADDAARELERELEVLQVELERSGEELGRAVEHAVEQLGREVEQLGEELEGLADELGRWWSGLG